MPEQVVRQQSSFMLRKGLEFTNKETSRGLRVSILVSVRI